VAEPAGPKDGKENPDLRAAYANPLLHHRAHALWVLAFECMGPVIIALCVGGGLTMHGRGCCQVS